jgi:sugar O-acyltransferase (sialic acid O-acetyltransferase NeuD family)
MKIAIVGAGGFAREVAWLISDIERHGSQGETSTPLEFVGYLVSDASKIGERDSEVLGDFSWLKKNRVDALAMGIGNPAVRLKLGNELREKFPDIKWPALIHPSVKYGPECVFGAGVNICAGTIATVNITFGNFCMVNLSCTIGHESQIGEGTVINPLCAISGGVNLGNRVLVGTHASVLQYLTVGDDAIVGSGAMVHKDVAAATTVMGVPAKPFAKASAAGH